MGSIGVPRSTTATSLARSSSSSAKSGALFARARAVGSSTSPRTSSATLRPLGKLTVAEQLLERVLEREPISIEVRSELAHVYFLEGRHDRAIELYEQVRAVDASLPFLRSNLGRALVFSGRPGDALPYLEDARSEHYLAHAYVRLGRTADAERLYAKHEAFPNRKAVIASALGRKDEAFAALEEMMASEPHRVIHRITDPEFAWLKDDPRHRALRRRLGIDH